MTISNDHVTGFVLGVGATAAAYYYYRKNQATVDDFLRRQGIEPPDISLKTDPADLSLDDLLREKERLEDLIAEREHRGERTEQSPAGPEAAPAPAPSESDTSPAS